MPRGTTPREKKQIKGDKKKMKLELSIKDDKELRDLIKDMIKGTVKGIAREQLNKQILESVRELFDMTMARHTGNFEALVMKAVKEEVKRYNRYDMEQMIKETVYSIVTESFEHRKERAQDIKS